MSHNLSISELPAPTRRRQNRRETEGIPLWTKEYEKYYVQNGGNILEHLLLNNYTYNEIAKFFQDALLIRLQKYDRLKNNLVNDKSAYSKIKKLIHQILVEADRPMQAKEINDKVNSIMVNKNKNYAGYILIMEVDNKNPLWKRIGRGIYEAV